MSHFLTFVFPATSSNLNGCKTPSLLTSSMAIRAVSSSERPWLGWLDPLISNSPAIRITRSSLEDVRGVPRKSPATKSWWQRRKSTKERDNRPGGGISVSTERMEHTSHLFLLVSTGIHPTEVFRHNAARPEPINQRFLQLAFWLDDAQKARGQGAGGLRITITLTTACRGEIESREEYEDILVKEHQKILKIEMRFHFDFHLMSSFEIIPKKSFSEFKESHYFVLVLESRLKRRAYLTFDHSKNTMFSFQKTMQDRID